MRLISVNIAIAAVYRLGCEVCIPLTAIGERNRHIEFDASFMGFLKEYI